MPLLQPDFFIAPSQTSPHMPAAQSSEDQTPMPDSLPLAVSSPAQVEVIAPSPQTQNKTGEPGVPARLSRANSQTEPQVPSVTDSLQTPATQDGVSPMSPAPNSNNPSAQSTKRFTLPLIRSKTGRIILPSSLKPSKLRPPAPTMILTPESNSLSVYHYYYYYYILTDVFSSFSYSWSGLLYTHGYGCEAERRGWYGRYEAL